MTIGDDAVEAGRLRTEFVVVTANVCVRPSVSPTVIGLEVPRTVAFAAPLTDDLAVNRVTDNRSAFTGRAKLTDTVPGLMSIALTSISKYQQSLGSHISRDRPTPVPQLSTDHNSPRALSPAAAHHAHHAGGPPPGVILSRDEALPRPRKVVVTLVTRTIRGLDTEVELGSEDGSRCSAPAPSSPPRSSCRVVCQLVLSGRKRDMPPGGSGSAERRGSDPICAPFVVTS